MLKKIDMLPGHMLVIPETRAGTGEVEGIFLPGRFGATPINVVRVVAIRPRAEDLRLLNVAPADLLGKRVLMKAVGGRPIHDGTPRRVYPMTLSRNPGEPEKRQDFESTILGIIDESAVVENLFPKDMRCAECGDARPGKRAGRGIMLQDRQIYGVMRPVCPRCHKDHEGTFWDPAKVWL